jgi:hypothetical protein
MADQSQSLPQFHPHSPSPSQESSSSSNVPPPPPTFGTPSSAAFLSDSSPPPNTFHGHAFHPSQPANAGSFRFVSCLISFMSKLPGSGSQLPG